MQKLLALAPLILLGACTAGPDFNPPAPPAPEAGYAQAGDTQDGAGRALMGEGPAGQWWQAFGSETLDALVRRALESNHSLAASKATLDSARAQVAAVAGKRMPQVDLAARAEYQQLNFSTLGLSDSFGIGNPEFDLYTLGGGISYDLDLFGRNRRALERAMAEAEAQQRATEAAHLLIAGRVVIQVLAIAALNDRIATERTLLKEDENNLFLTEARHRAGAGTMVDVLSAQGQLAADRGTLPGLEQQRAEGRAMLALLLGISPAELGPTPFSLNDFQLPGQVPVALPSALVRKRPDILEAEARLHAATAAVGVATADLYPNITLGATITQSSSDAENVLQSRYNAFDLFAGLTAPIFHGGTLSARKSAAEAEAKASAELYRQTVLEAFSQVSGLLSALETDGRTLAASQQAADIAERSLYLSRRSFQVGNSGILQVLDSSRSNYRARLALVEARASQYRNIARLYAATAGGWTNGVPAAEQQANTPQ